MYYLKVTRKDGKTYYIGNDITGTSFIQNVDKDKLVPFITFGTGFFVSKKGLIVTNRHVAYPWEEPLAELKEQNQDTFADIEELRVFLGILPNGTMITTSEKDNLVVMANKVARTFYQCDLKSKHKDPNIDLALIKMQADALPPETDYIAPENIANKSFTYEKGKDIFMIGYPGGLTFATARQVRFNVIENTLSSGIISKASDRYQVQYDLSSGSGSSGSPVFDRSGKVIAVNYALTDLQGALINYGIKSSYIHELLEEVDSFSFTRFFIVLLIRIFLFSIPYAGYEIFKTVKPGLSNLKKNPREIIKTIFYALISLIVIIANLCI